MKTLATVIAATILALSAPISAASSKGGSGTYNSNSNINSNRNSNHNAAYGGSVGNVTATGGTGGLGGMGGLGGAGGSAAGGTGFGGLGGTGLGGSGTSSVGDVSTGDQNVTVNQKSGGNNADWWVIFAGGSHAYPGNNTADGLETKAFGVGPISGSWATDNERAAGRDAMILGAAQGDKELENMGREIYMLRNKEILDDLRSRKPSKSTNSNNNLNSNSNVNVSRGGSASPGSTDVYGGFSVE